MTTIQVSAEVWLLGILMACAIAIAIQSAALLLKAGMHDVAAALREVASAIRPTYINGRPPPAYEDVARSAVGALREIRDALAHKEGRTP